MQLMTAHLGNNQINIVLKKNLNLISKLLHHYILSSTLCIQVSSLIDAASKIHPAFFGHLFGKITCCLAYFRDLPNNIIVNTGRKARILKRSKKC